MNRIHYYVLLVCFLIIFTGCMNDSAAKSDMDYDQTKKMVVDILQTDEGKKALREVLRDEKLKEQLIIDADEVKSTITSMLLSEDGTEMWKKLFEDPKFVEQFLASMEEEQEKLFKRLMDDATFQKKLLEVMQNPEMADLVITTLKSQQFRAHLEDRIQETLQTPTFQAKMQDLLLKAAEKQSSGGQSGSQNDSSSEQDQGENKEQNDSESSPEQSSE